MYSTYKVTTVQPGKKYTVSLNDLFGDEERDIVMDVQLPAIPETQGKFYFKIYLNFDILTLISENYPLVVAKVSYTNLITKAPGDAVGFVNVNRTATELEKREV